jgi:uncharacterized protein
MLLVDLNRLEREGRARIDTDLDPEDPFWQGLDVRPHGPLAVRLEAQQAGPDVVVRGRIEGEFDLDCRRCLEPVVAGIDEEVGLLYRAGDAAADDESPDVLALPRAATVDLSVPLREQVLVAVPRYVYCRANCAGLCPECGTNLNEAACSCTSEGVDERWAPLRELRKDQ